jgi:hypothetical protein
MSASAITDGVISLLSAASVFGASMVGNHKYDALEQCGGSCAAVFCTGFVSDESTYGNQRKHDWNYVIESYYRFTGDYDAVRNMAQTGLDLVLSTIESDPTIQGTAFSIGQITGNVPPALNVEIGGAYWMLTPFNVVIREYT